MESLWERLEQQPQHVHGCDDDECEEDECDRHRCDDESSCCDGEREPVECPRFPVVVQEIGLANEADEFVVGEPVPCRNACGEMYCSAMCAEDRWRSTHHLLCPASSSAMKGQQQATFLAPMPV